MNVLEELDQAGAILADQHFVYSSGMHGPDFVRIDALMSQSNLFTRVCGELVSGFLNDEVEVVTACSNDRCSRIAHLSAEHLGVEAGSAEAVRGKRTLVVEDVLTTGTEVIKIRQHAQDFGAQVIGAGIILNRGSVTASTLGVPRLETLVNVNLLAFEPDQCELCESGKPIVEDVGRGAIFRQRYPEYVGGFVRILTNNT